MDAQIQAMYELTARKRAMEYFLTFIVYTKWDVSINLQYRVLAEKLQAFAEGRTRKLMMFLPPQVGKNEMSTRRLPSYM